MLRATATPLASIFGSGFLIVVPVLEPSFGRASFVAMALVCALAYAIGTAVRHNIRYSEAVDAQQLGTLTARLRWSCTGLIAIAYTISVALYLQIMSTYALTYLGADGASHERWLSTSVIVALVVVGVTRGFAGLERIEYAALALTLLIIVAMTTVFAVHDLGALHRGALELPPMTDVGLLQEAMLLGGILICVQGFETSRYLGAEFSEEVRIRSSRWSQRISTVVYIAFVLVCTPLMATTVPGADADGDLLQLTRSVAPWLVLPLAGVAVFSQLSAAIADLVTGIGNVDELTRRRAREAISYVGLGAVAIAMVWAVSTLQLVAVASRAFAVYYVVQCLIASRTARSSRATLLYLLLAAPLVFVALFARPVG